MKWTCKIGISLVFHLVILWLENGLMKIVLNVFHLSDKKVKLLQIFFDELSDGYNVEMFIKTLWTDF